MAQENFERVWCWLYPIAFTLSRSPINTLWNSTSPNWIEGFITKEEAELSLKGPRGLQEPGTFLLRFPTSRSWPHPDAGSLIVTYVGSDYTVHHRLLSLDHIHRCVCFQPFALPIFLDGKLWNMLCLLLLNAQIYLCIHVAFRCLSYSTFIIIFSVRGGEMDERRKEMFVVD